MRVDKPIGVPEVPELGDTFELLDGTKGTVVDYIIEDDDYEDAFVVKLEDGTIQHVPYLIKSELFGAKPDGIDVWKQTVLLYGTGSPKLMEAAVRAVRSKL